MPFLLLKLSDARQIADARPQQCPYCGSIVLQRWGRDLQRPVSLRMPKTAVYRYRCNRCKRTFRHSPEIMDRLIQTQQVRRAAGLAWALGMSCRQVVDAFETRGFHLSRMTVWREGQRFIDEKGHSQGNGEVKKPFVIDRFYVKGASRKLGLVVVLDFGLGGSLLLGTLNEGDPRLVKSWMESHLEGILVDVMVGNTGQLVQYEDTLQGIEHV